MNSHRSAKFFFGCLFITLESEWPGWQDCIRGASVVGTAGCPLLQEHVGSRRLYSHFLHGRRYGHPLKGGATVVRAHAQLGIEHLRSWNATQHTPTFNGPSSRTTRVRRHQKAIGWRGGATVGRRTCDQEVASSIPGQARLRNDSGQVVHTQLPRRWHSSLVVIESLNWLPLPLESYRRGTVRCAVTVKTVLNVAQMFV